MIEIRNPIIIFENRFRFIMANFNLHLFVILFIRKFARGILDQLTTLISA